MIDATGIDVLVLAITTASKLARVEIWLAFAQKDKFPYMYIAAHTIADHL